MLFAIQSYLYPPLEGEKLVSIRVLSFEKSSHVGYTIGADSMGKVLSGFVIAKTGVITVDSIQTNRQKERIFRIDTKMIKVKRRTI